MNEILQLGLWIIGIVSFALIVVYILERKLK